MPTWTIIHKRFWKLQVPYLARHHRVVTYDGPGNGRSDRPLDPAAYDHDRQVEYALDVLDATGTDRAVLVGLSLGRDVGAAARRRARRPGAGHGGDRRLGAAHRSASLPACSRPSTRPRLPASRVPLVDRDPLEHWAKYDPAFWEDRHEDFLWFFFGMCFPEPRSTKPIEDCVAWGLDTVPEVLTAEWRRAPSRLGKPSRTGVRPSALRSSRSTATAT